MSATKEMPARGTRRHSFRLMRWVASVGGWWCLDCQEPTERVESDQGQPAGCSRCGSHRVVTRDQLLGTI